MYHASSLIRVVFHPPDSQTRAVVFHQGILTEKLSKTFVLWYIKPTFFKLMSQCLNLNGSALVLKFCLTVKLSRVSHSLSNSLNLEVKSK